MKKFGRHVDVWPIRQASVTVKLLIVIRVHESKLFPRMQHFSFLWIPTSELIVNVRIPAAFVTIVPEKNTGMIHVTLNHLTNQPLACRCVVGALPTTEFIQNIQAQLVTSLEKVHIGWVMRHAYRIHVQFFDQIYVVVTDAFAECSSRIWPKGVTVDSL